MKVSDTNHDQKSTENNDGDNIRPNGLSQKDIDVQTDVKPKDPLLCGYGKCVPSWLQICNNPRAFVAWLCWFSFIQGFIVNGINNVNTSTLERRFNLPSSQVSLISSSYDIAAGLFAIPVGFFGANAHKPRLLAFAALVMSLGSFVMTVPHWVTGYYELGEPIADRCDLTGNNTSCDTIDTGLGRYLYVFMGGQFLHGIGGTTLYTLGIVFIDENVKMQSSAMYQGIMQAFSVLGPGLGYILGGVFLAIYVDIGRVDLNEIEVDPDDPRWVGAWWIGFLAGGCLAITIFFALVPYPYELPQAAEAKASRVSEVHQRGTDVEISDRTTLADFLVSMKYLFTNPVNILVALAGCCEIIIVSGFATFMPKFIQSQFGLTASTAALLGGGLAVPGAAGGQLLGGFLCKWRKLKVRGMLKLGMAVAVTAGVLSTTFLSRCSQDLIAGITVPYYNISQDVKFDDINLNHPCNIDCQCTSRSYEPLCGDDGIQYFSPCHAGCLDFDTVENDKLYNNCSCITQADSNTGISGKCSTNCSLLYVFIPFFLIVIVTNFMTVVPGINITFRCIPDNQRSLGLGFRWTLMRFLGSVPGPILFGAIFDSSCILWQEKCSERGSCWIYDRESLGYKVLGTVAGLKAVSFVFFLLAYLVYKPPPPIVLHETNVQGETKVDASNNNIKGDTLPIDICDKQVVVNDENFDSKDDGVDNVAFMGTDELDQKVNTTSCNGPSTTHINGLSQEYELTKF